MNLFRGPSELRSRDLLTACDLPTADLTPQHFDHFLGWGTADQLEGIVGVELFGIDALLRSLAVVTAARGKGVGKALVVGAEQYAQQNNVQTLYLLTNTAVPFFTRLGYATVSRTTAPEAIQRTPEFSNLCPDSTTFMMKALGPNSG